MEVKPMIKETDMKWHEHYENNIQTNPIGEYYCIVDLGERARKYGIAPQHPSIDGIVIDRNQDPELFILFESIGRKATDEDKQEIFYDSVNYDGYVFENERFVRAFRTLDEAKKRAYVQYRAVFGYALSHICPHVDDATNKHFVV
jgi:hypothetical protein